MPRANQASLSERTLSRWPDEAGLKYLNHREETELSDTDSLFKASTSIRSRRQITQLLTICEKTMLFSTNEPNWLPPPEWSVFLTRVPHSMFTRSGSQSAVHKNITARRRLTWKRHACYSSRVYLGLGAMVTQRSSASRTSRSAGNLRWCMIAWNKCIMKNDKSRLSVSTGMRGLSFYYDHKHSSSAFRYLPSF